MNTHTEEKTFLSSNVLQLFNQKIYGSLFWIVSAEYWPDLCEQPE